MQTMRHDFQVLMSKIETTIFGVACDQMINIAFIQFENFTPRCDVVLNF